VQTESQNRKRDERAAAGDTIDSAGDCAGDDEDQWLDNGQEKFSARACSSALTISMVASAASRPLLPNFIPARSRA
jgi:hypothetical protein